LEVHKEEEGDLYARLVRESEPSEGEERIEVGFIIPREESTPSFRCTCFWISGFGFRISGFVFRVSHFGFRVSYFGFRI